MWSILLEKEWFLQFLRTSVCKLGWSVPSSDSESFLYGDNHLVKLKELIIGIITKAYIETYANNDYLIF